MLCLAKHSSISVAKHVRSHCGTVYCQTEHALLPEDGTYVSKHVGEVHLTFLLIKNVRLNGTINGLR
jgi:hypothetical protein